MTNFTTVFILPNSTSFDIIRTFVHTLLTVPDPNVKTPMLTVAFYRFPEAVTVASAKAESMSLNNLGANEPLVRCA